MVMSSKLELAMPIYSANSTLAFTFYFGNLSVDIFFLPHKILMKII